MKNSNQYKIALSLSAFILPGLGQVHLKQRKKGWLMILLCFFAILFVFGKFMMGLLIVLEASHQKREPLAHLFQQLWQAAVLQKTGLLGGLFFLLAVWIWSVWDIWKSQPRSGESNSS